VNFLVEILERVTLVICPIIMRSLFLVFQGQI